MALLRRLIVALAATLALSGFAVGIEASPAHADTPGCVNYTVPLFGQHWDTWNFYTGEGAWSSQNIVVPYFSCRDANISSVTTYDRYNFNPPGRCATFWVYDVTTNRNYPWDWHAGKLICGNQPFGYVVAAYGIPDGHTIRMGVHPWPEGPDCIIPAGCNFGYRLGL